MKSDFYAAISQIAAERGIPKEAIVEVMEKALVTAYRRTLGNNPPPIEVSVKLDPQTGSAHVYAEKQVVDEVFDDRFEIDYVIAKRIKSDVEMGETVLVESTPNEGATTWMTVLSELHNEDGIKRVAEAFSCDPRLVAARGIEVRQLLDGRGEESIGSNAPRVAGHTKQKG